MATLDQDGFLGFVNAGAEASMVGAIADWFAVTALFRHPLGLPIPHTALIPRRKDDFGKSLEEFFSENFLNEQVIRERLDSADIARRVGAWVSQPANADRVVAEGASVLAIGLRRLRDADVASVVEEVLIPRFMAEPISPVAGGLLQEIVADNAHHGLVDLALEEGHRWLVHNQDTFADVVGERAPWWAPERLNDAVTTPAAPRGGALGRRHPARPAPPRPPGAGQPAAPAGRRPAQRPVHAGAGRAAQDCGCSSSRRWSSPGCRCGAPSARRCSRRSRTRRARCGPGPSRELVGFGERIGRDDVLRQRLDTWGADFAVWAVGRYGDELTAVITSTIERWDGEEAARKIELHVGRDLQFIRINGTIVGGLVGVADPRGLAGDLGSERMDDVPIRDESIRLGQFLKLANLIDSGSDAKELMVQGLVTVNGEVETRRGRQLVPGDVVSLGGAEARVARA